MSALKNYKNLILKNIILASLIVLFNVPTHPLLADATKAAIQNSGDLGENTGVIGSQSHFIARETPIELAEAAANPKTQDLEIRTRRGSVYTFDYILTSSPVTQPHIGTDSGTPPPNPEDDENISRAYEQMSDVDRQRFQENRVLFLTHAATLLDRTDLVVGFGSIAKHKLKTVCGNLWPKKNPVEVLAKNSLPDHEETPQTVKERGQDVIQGILDTFDRELWISAPVVANRNEFTVSVGISGIIEGGVGQKGHGGSIGLGINIGYNRDNQAIVFEIVSGIDSFKRAFTPFFMVGLIPSLGYGLRVNQNGREIEKSIGRTTYPLAVPGYFSRSAHMLSLGWSSALFSFPPLIGDSFWYVNKTTRKPLFRVELSAMSKRFIRVFTPKGKSQASNHPEIPSDELAFNETKTIGAMLDIVSGWFQKHISFCSRFLKKS